MKTMRLITAILLTTIAATITVVVVKVYFPEEKIIKIGFFGLLSGRNSDYTIASRNGVIFAIEEVNRKGGIKGKKLVLVQKDIAAHHAAGDVGAVIESFKKEGISILIGPCISQASIEALPHLNKNEILAVSPSATSDHLSGMDDFYLRVSAPDFLTAPFFAEYLYVKKGYRKISATYDFANRAYSKNFVMQVKTNFEKLGGTLFIADPFESGPEFRKFFHGSIESLLKNPSDALMIVGNAVDTARFCQEIRKRKIDLTLLSSEWSMTSDIIQHGGDSIEGALFPSPYFIDETGRDSKLFAKNFRDRFGKELNLVNIFGYDAAKVIISAFEKSDKRDSTSIKKTILSEKRYESLLGPFSIDSFGDARRTISIVTVKNGKFTRVEE